MCHSNRTLLAISLCTSLVASSAHALAPKDVYKKAGPAVVLILGSDDGRNGSGGTGSIITGEGKVITNAHVVINSQGKPYKTLYVFLKPPKITGDNGKDLANRYKARVLAYSPAEELDLALLQIESAPANLPTIPFADPDAVEIGDEVVAIGHPEQGGLWTLTTGTISTLIANFNSIKGKHVFQTEASVNRGNSGGPLLDANGNMVGINTMIARQAADGLTITSVNFSLKSSVATTWLAGQGMGLAYAPKPEQPLVVAVAPQQNKPATSADAGGSSAGASGSGATTSTVVAQNDAKPAPAQQVTTPPPSTIVVAEAPPAKPETVRQEAQNLGKAKEGEKLEGGQPLDPKKAKPKFHTPKKPFSIDDLRKQQMKEMEDLMDEMRGKTRGGKGAGLW